MCADAVTWPEAVATLKERGADLVRTYHPLAERYWRIDDLARCAPDLYSGGCIVDEHCVYFSSTRGTHGALAMRPVRLKTLQDVMSYLARESSWVELSETFLEALGSASQRCFAVHADSVVRWDGSGWGHVCKLSG